MHSQKSSISQPSHFSTLIPNNCTHQNDKLTESNVFESALFIKHLNSNEIVYETKTKEPKIIGNYIFGDILGQGSYSKVKEAFNIETLQRCAIKIMKNKRLVKIPQGQLHVKNEIHILRKLGHKNIISLVQVFNCNFKDKIFMVMEFCCDSIQNLIREKGKLGSDEARFFFKQLVEGLVYLKSKSIVHRDIKPGNLLITTEGVLKISDFGVAQEFSMFEPSNDLCSSSSGTPAFQCPEIASGSIKFSGEMVDVWASGVTLFNMVTGDFPFSGSSVFDLYDNVQKKDLEIPPGLCCEHLLVKLLEKDPLNRITLLELAVDPWVLVDTNFVWKKNLKETSVIPYLSYMFHKNPIRKPSCCLF